MDVHLSGSRLVHIHVLKMIETKFDMSVPPYHVTLLAILCIDMGGLCLILEMLLVIKTEVKERYSCRVTVEERRQAALVPEC